MAMLFCDFALSTTLPIGNGNRISDYKYYYISFKIIFLQLQVCKRFPCGINQIRDFTHAKRLESLANFLVFGL
jgi:hypothetical protein